MWTPRQLLHDDVVLALRRDGIPELLIEFLGWSSGRANTLNHSSNPVKSARTMLREPHQLNAKGENNAKTHQYLDKFCKRKADSIHPEVETTMDSATKAARRIEQLLRNEEKPYHDDDAEQAALDKE